jgi:hypothetical protein
MVLILEYIYYRLRCIDLLDIFNNVLIDVNILVERLICWCKVWYLCYAYVNFYNDLNLCI